MNKYYEKNKELYKKRAREWEKENPKRNRELCRKREKKYRLKNKENRIKYDARRTARKKGLKDKKCSRCGSIENLNFHHTNYKKNKGKTLCKDCHLKEHPNGF